MSQSMTNPLNNIAELAQLINSGTSYDETLKSIVYAVCRHTHWSMSAILSMDLNKNKVIARARFDTYIDKQNDIPSEWPLASSPTTDVVRAHQPLVIENMQLSEKYIDHRNDAIKRNYFTVVVLPLEASDQYNNPMALSVFSRKVIEVDSNELSFLSTLSNLAAIAVKQMLYLQREQARTEQLQATIGHSASLMDLALSDSPILRILEAAEALLQHPVILVDSMQQLIFLGSPPAMLRLTHKQWQESIQERQHQQILEAVRDTQQDSEHKQMTLTLPNKTQTHCAIEMLVIDKEIVGALLLLDIEGQQDPFQGLMTEQTQFALRALMMRNFIKFQSETDSLTDLYQQLITQNWRNSDDFIARAQHKGVRLDQPNHLYSICIDDHSGYQTIAELLHSRHQQVASQINKVFEQATCIIYEDFYLVSFPVSSCLSHAQLLSRLNTLEKSLRWIFNTGLTITTGQPCIQLTDYALSWRSHKRLIQLGRQFNRHGILNEESFGAYAILFAATNQSVVSEFINKSLMKIEQYDKKHKNKLLDTLAAFLNNNCRYQQSADVLDIHVTTLRYRVERIEELFNIDFDDADQRFGLDLALRLRHMTGSAV